MTTIKPSPFKALQVWYRDDVASNPKRDGDSCDQDWVLDMMDSNEEALMNLNAQRASLGMGNIPIEKIYTRYRLYPNQSLKISTVVDRLVIEDSIDYYMK